MTNLTTVSPVTENVPFSFGKREDLNDWTVSVTPSMKNAVPATVNRTVITLHSHQIIVERQDSLFRALSVVENVLLVTSSVFLIGVSASSVLFALSAIGTL